MARQSDSDLLKCSFCGKRNEQVKKLIAGPSVYICSECLHRCNEIIEVEVPSWPWRPTGAWWWHATGEPPDEARVALDPNSRVMATFTRAGRVCAIALSDAGLLRREMLDELIDPEVALRYLKANDVDTSRVERGLAEEISKNALWQAGLLRREALNEAMDPDVAIGLLKANHLDTSPLEQYLADLHGGSEA